MQTYFDLLDLDARTATILDVRRAFRARAARLHPDGGARTASQLAELQALTEAYTEIKTEAKLAAYRASLLGEAVEADRVAATAAAGCRPETQASGRSSARSAAPAEQGATPAESGGWTHPERPSESGAGMAREGGARTKPVRPAQARYFSDLDMMRFDLGGRPEARRLVAILPRYRRCLHATPVERRICPECMGRELALTGETVTMILLLTPSEIAAGEARRAFEAFEGHAGGVQFVFDPHSRMLPIFDGRPESALAESVPHPGFRSAAASYDVASRGRHAFGTAARPADGRPTSGAAHRARPTSASGSARGSGTRADDPRGPCLNLSAAAVLGIVAGAIAIAAWVMSAF